MNMINKALIVTLTLGFTLAHAEDFLPGRVQSRNKGHQIAAKCALRNATDQSCAGYQFYFLEKGLTENAQLIGKGILTVENLTHLKKSGSTYNVLSERKGEFGSITKDSWEILEDLHEARASESIVGDVVYGFFYGLGYAVFTPVAAAGDALGTALGSPFFLIGKSARNSKINKLVNSIETGKIEKLDIDRLRALEHMLWCQTNSEAQEWECSL